MEAADDASVWVERMTMSLNGNSVKCVRHGTSNAPQGRRYDAVNGAVPGYTLAVSVDQLAQRIAPFEPDIVVVNQVTTDIAAHSRRQVRRPTQTQVASSTVGRFFHQNSLLLNLLRQNTAAFRSKRIPSTPNERLDERGIEKYAETLTKLVELCRQRGWRIVLCTCPRSFGDETAPTDQHVLAATALANNPALSLAGLDDAFNRYNDAIRGVAATGGVPLVDLDLLVPKRAEYFVDAVHLSDAGHRLVANLVADEIRRLATGDSVARNGP
jgi:lysophospholipase L1-like esterase